jgi:Ca-activated chloride channel homolog
VKRFSKVIVALAYLVVTVVAVQSVQGQQQRGASDEDVVRVDTTLVTLPIRVTNRQGGVVYGLKPEQFRVFENGVEQEIAYFEAPASVDNFISVPKPLTVALMLDISDSTQFKLQKIQSTALAFLDLLRPADRVMVISFDRQINVLTEETADRTVLKQAILSIRTGGGTTLYGALEEVISRRLSRAQGRKAIVLLTDGVDTASKQESFESSIRAAETSDVTIFPVQYPTYADFSDNPSREAYGVGSFGALSHVTMNGELASVAYNRGNRYLRLLADKTAGRFQFADSANKLARSFASIATQLREQYTIAYYPKSKVEERRAIKVRTVMPNVNVRTRQSYIYRSRTKRPRQ